MGRVRLTEEVINKELEDSFNNQSDVDIPRIIEILISIKEIDT